MLKVSPIDKKSLALGYCLWGLSCVGICGVQRIYIGHIGLGLFMLFTFGFCGIGQIFDLFLLPDAVFQANKAFLNNTSDEHTRKKASSSQVSQSNISLRKSSLSSPSFKKDEDLEALLRKAKNSVARTDDLPH